MLRNRDGYPVWKFKMKMLLLHEELWSSIAGYESSDKTSLEDRLRHDQKALSKTCLTVDGSAISHVRTAKTAKETWNAIQKAYEDTANLVHSDCQDFQLWHKRLGHLCRVSMDLLRKGLDTGVEYTAVDKEPCIPCVEVEVRLYRQSCNSRDTIHDRGVLSLAAALSDGLHAGPNHVQLYRQSCNSRDTIDDRGVLSLAAALSDGLHAGPNYVQLYRQSCNSRDTINDRGVLSLAAGRCP
ncbi:Uncharacterized protein OBRU01_14307 [Operophtera brumata]|uniref:Retrovirus-related Pol polyprotein from transposon TNT 1-94 n=1 Tax=Operophtera brumata TaxID=104452 RepID=A0A0L7KU60_OPEBR|nr:Uncharacterized protein OBRU01_14307 [Operophtera brumata]